VVKFLWKARERKLIELWPRSAPHLLFTASLEARQPELNAAQARGTATNWRDLRKRAKRLSYNQKIDRFAEAQQNFRAIAQKRSGDANHPPPEWSLLNIETVVVKPEWLVGTFAFNPMLGFRRRLQAASIAHGCASTLVELCQRQRQNPEWARHWGIQTDLGFDHKVSSKPGTLEPLKRTKAQQRDGKCWFRNATCPFSKAAVEKLGPGLRPTADIAAAVDEIYQLCGNKRTHQKDAPETL
jgi:hypothetical protein